MNLRKKTIPILLQPQTYSKPFKKSDYLASLGYPCSSNLPKAFQEYRVSVSLAFLILDSLQERALDASRIKKAYHFRDRLCDSDWIRTNGPHLRRMTLYPAELPNPLLWLQI